MKIYHQCGHNFIWNLQSYSEDQVGDGFILSPVNIEAIKIRERFSSEMLSKSWIDPQMYLPEDGKGNLSTYPFFPSNVVNPFSTSDFKECAGEVARDCLTFQNSLGLKYHVIPARHYVDLPENYFSQLEALYVEPFLCASDNLGLSTPLLLTLIVKPFQLEKGVSRDEILSWATSFSEISGIYLILENQFSSKMIKDPAYLSGAMRFIKVLRDNDLEVHLGYTGAEGLLYSIPDATSASIGSYENLRSFDISRLMTLENEERRGPRPRIYSAKLLQWIVDTSIPALRELMLNWQSLFDYTKYKDYLLDSQTSLNFQRSEIYKHYFLLYSSQIKSLPRVSERPDHIKKLIHNSLALFEQINTSGVFLDSDSDGSHLAPWINAITMFERNPE